LSVQSRIPLLCACDTKLIEQAPLEMLELILMRAFVMLYVRHYRRAIICAGERTYGTLARVCSIWWQTLDGWPQSDTRLWLKHQIVKRVAGRSNQVESCYYDAI